MATPSETVRRLHADRDNGALEALCAEHDVDLLTLFGSARTRPDTAGDVDVAFSFLGGAKGDELDVINALLHRYGDVIDVMALDRAGAVASYSALCLGDVLVETTPDKFATRQIAAFQRYVDEGRYTDLRIEALRR